MSSAANKAEAMAAMLRQVWTSQRGTAIARVQTVQDFVAKRNSSDPGRAEAISEAHKLSGALGSFGLAIGSEIARELELELAGDDLDSSWDELTRQAATLREHVENFQP